MIGISRELSDTLHIYNQSRKILEHSEGALKNLTLARSSSVNDEKIIIEPPIQLVIECRPNIFELQVREIYREDHLHTILIHSN